MIERRITFDTYYKGELASHTTVTFDSDLVLVAEVHNDVSIWSKSVFEDLLDTFEVIKTTCREYGVSQLITYSKYHDNKMQKYWEMMGFTNFGSVTKDNTEYPFAKMEI